MTWTYSSTRLFTARGLAIVMEDMVGRPVHHRWDAWSGLLDDWSPPFSGYHLYYPKPALPHPRRSLRFWRNCGPTLIYKQGQIASRL